RYNAMPEEVIRDFARFPELRWLDRYWLVPPFAPAAGGFFAGGLPMLMVGFFLSTLLDFPAPFIIHPPSHLSGRPRRGAGDDSRTSALLALITGGEGWHNNRHHYPGAANNGFFWWELDTTYYGIRVLSWLGLARDVRGVPRHVRDGGRLEPASSVEAARAW